MPATRRSSGGPRSSQATAKQSTLSFNHKVTKSVPKSAKKAISSTTPVKASPLSKQIFKEEDIEVEEQDQGQKPETTSQVIAEPTEKSEAELRAGKIGDRQVTSYWNKQERDRTAKRVHQEGLTLAEKVLRYFDVSNQYGPCVGLSRMKRWQRADKLGLNPPVEVLAVLLKEQEKSTKNIELAYMDQILNPTAVDAV